MPNEESDRFNTEEGLIVIETPDEDGNILVQELGHFEYVIYQYWKRPWDERLIWSTIEDKIKKYGKEYLKEILEKLQTGSEHEEKPDLNEIDNTSQAFMIDEKDTGAKFFAERITELEKRCDEMKTISPTNIDLARWQNNKKKAKRRLRRWLKENEVEAVEVPEQYRALVKRVIDEGPGEQIDVYDIDLISKILWEDGHIEDVREYWQRKTKRVILVVHKLPFQIKELLNEASEAYYHGLFRATATLCRAMLEDLLRRIVQVQSVQAGPTPINDERLEVLINCMPKHLLPSEERITSHEIRKLGNQVLHDPNVYISEENAWRLLTKTGRLVEGLINRGGLEPV